MSRCVCCVQCMRVSLTNAARSRKPLCESTNQMMHRPRGSTNRRFVCILSASKQRYDKFQIISVPFRMYPGYRPENFRMKLIHLERSECSGTGNVSIPSRSDDVMWASVARHVANFQARLPCTDTCVARMDGAIERHTEPPAGSGNLLCSTSVVTKLGVALASRPCAACARSAHS